MVTPLSQGFKGRALRLAPADITAAAKRLGCEEAVIRALLSVESAGSGFDANGRPKILFEPHIFYRNLVKDPVKRLTAVKAGLAYQVWGTLPYPPGSDAQYDRLTRACAIDVDAALKSASWGMAQVMGGNFETCNYADPSSFVLAAMDSEANQLNMMLAYMEHAGLVPAMRAKQWALIAEKYNGPGAVQAYATKMANAYAHSDATPSTANVPVPIHPEVTADSLNDQQYLKIRAGQA